MHHHILRSVTFAVALATCFSVTSCSRQSRTTRQAELAAQHYAAGRYDEAEIAYKNLLRDNPSDAATIARLGAIYHAAGREPQAIMFLRRAKELQPTNLEARTHLALAMLAVGAVPQARQEALSVLEQQPNNEDALLMVAETVATPQDIEATRKLILGMPDAVKAGAPALVALGQLELRAKRIKQAESLFQQALLKDPQSVNASAALGMLYWGRRDLISADAALKKAADAAPIRSPRRINYAQFLLQTGKEEEAKRFLDDLTKRAPDYFPAHIWRAEMALSDKDYARAEELVKRVLARDNIHTETLILAGRLALAREDAAEAIKILSRTANLYPKSALAHFNLGLAYQASGDVPRAAESLRRAVALAPGMVPAVVALAEVDLKAGDHNAAISALQPLVEKNPGATPARLLLAQAYQAQSNPDQALAQYQELEKRYPKSAQMTYLRAVALVRANKRDEARKAFQRAAEQMENPYPAVEQLVNLDIADKNFAAARQRAEKEAQRTPKLAAPHILIARAYLAERKVAEAQAALERASEVQPENPTAFLFLAQIHAHSGDAAKATSSLQQAVEKNPKDVRALTQLAVLLEEQKKYDAARDVYEKLLQVNPNSPIALNNLAFIHAERFKQPEKALPLAERAHALLQNDPRAADTLAWIHFRLKQYPKAAQLLRETAAKLPDDPDVQFHAGMALYMMGQEADARATLTSALEKNPQLNGRDEAEAKLAILAIAPEAIGAADRAKLEAARASSPEDPVVLTRLSILHLKAGDLAKAREAADEAVRLNPKNARANLQLVEVLTAQGERKRAIDLAKATRALAPDDVDTAYRLGRLVYDAGEYRWAASLLRDVAGNRPNDPEAQLDWALAAYSIGQVDDATSAVTQALETPGALSRTAEAKRFLELISFTADEATPEARERVLQLAKSEPTSVPALMASGALHQARGDLKSAQQAYEKALARYPEFTPAHRALAIVYSANAADLQKAAAIAAKARQAYPSDADVAKAVGIITYRQGDYGRAATLLQESSRARGSDSEVLYYLGMSQFQLKKTDQSKQTLQRAIDLGLKNELMTEARRVLAQKD